MHASQVKDQVVIRDRYGRILVKVDAWIYEVAWRRGDLKRWGLA